MTARRTRRKRRSLKRYAGKARYRPRYRYGRRWGYQYKKRRYPKYRRRYRKRRIFKKTTIANLSRCIKWIRDNQQSIQNWIVLPGNQAGEGMVYDTVLTLDRFLAILIRKTALYIYRYRSGIKVLPKLYSKFNRGDPEQAVVGDGELPSFVNNAKYKQFRSLGGMLRRQNPLGEEWKSTIRKQQNPMTISVLIAYSGININKINNLIHVISTNKYRLAARILVCMINILQYLATQYNVIPIYSIINGL